MADAEEGAPPPGDTLKILLATDNHVGYLENDPIRGNDSFITFEEIFKIAKAREVDFVLLGGDLFHEVRCGCCCPLSHVHTHHITHLITPLSQNKPSRRTLQRTLQILRRHCLGDNPVSFKITSDQAAHFTSAPNNEVNYEDPFFSVDLPVFTIHGNHDDPTREGGRHSLSAVDLLATCNLVNYFGKQESVEDIEIAPILMEKGETTFALYGLGNIRDERLNRMFTQRKVKFVLPAEEADFSIFVLHQNRDFGRGPKNCIHEHMLPSFLNLVMWGHEHECMLTPVQTQGGEGEWFLTQPGSSVATSLVPGEAKQKQVGILEVYKDQFRLWPVALQTTRPFLVRHCSLEELIDEADDIINPDDPDATVRVETLLTDTVNEMLRAAAPALAKAAAAAALALGREAGAGGIQAMLPLVRLKVNHTGYGNISIPNHTFGRQFVGRVANHEDILLFSRNKAVRGGKKRSAEDDGAMFDALRSDAAAVQDEVTIEEFVTTCLATADSTLKLLPEVDMNEALSRFIQKEDNKAITQQVQTVLERVRGNLVSKVSARGGASDIQDMVEEMTAATQAAAAMQEAEAAGEEEEEGMEMGGGGGGGGGRRERASASSSSASSSAAAESSSASASRRGKEDPFSKSRSSSAATKKKTTKASGRRSLPTTKENDSEVDDEATTSEDDDGYEEESPARGRGKAKAKAKRKAPAKKAKRKAPAKKSPQKRPAPKKAPARSRRRARDEDDEQEHGDTDASQRSSVSDWGSRAKNKRSRGSK